MLSFKNNNTANKQAEDFLKIDYCKKKKKRAQQIYM